MSKILVLSKDVFSDYTSISATGILRGVVQLTREKFPIDGLTIYEATVGNVLLSSDNKKEIFDKANEEVISIKVGSDYVIHPKKDFVDIFNIEAIKQCESAELEIIKNYHIKNENYELLSKIV